MPINVELSTLATQSGIDPQLIRVVVVLFLLNATIFAAWWRMDDGD